MQTSAAAPAEALDNPGPAADESVALDNAGDEPQGHANSGRSEATRRHSNEPEAARETIAGRGAAQNDPRRRSPAAGAQDQGPSRPRSSGRLPYYPPDYAGEDENGYDDDREYGGYPGYPRSWTPGSSSSRRSAMMHMPSSRLQRDFYPPQFGRHGPRHGYSGYPDSQSPRNTMDSADWETPYYSNYRYHQDAIDYDNFFRRERRTPRHFMILMKWIIPWILNFVETRYVQGIARRNQPQYPFHLPSRRTSAMPQQHSDSPASAPPATPRNTDEGDLTNAGLGISGHHLLLTREAPTPARLGSLEPDERFSSRPSSASSRLRPEPLDYLSRFESNSVALEDPYDDISGRRYSFLQPSNFTEMLTMEPSMFGMQADGGVIQAATPSCLPSEMLRRMNADGANDEAEDAAPSFGGFLQPRSPFPSSDMGILPSRSPPMLPSTFLSTEFIGYEEDSRGGRSPPFINNDTPSSPAETRPTTVNAPRQRQTKPKPRAPKKTSKPTSSLRNEVGTSSTAGTQQTTASSRNSRTVPQQPVEIGPPLQRRIHRRSLTPEASCPILTFQEYEIKWTNTPFHIGMLDEEPHHIPGFTISSADDPPLNEARFENYLRSILRSMDNITHLQTPKEVVYDRALQCIKELTASAKEKREIVAALEREISELKASLLSQ
ncbi:hypothetical protein BDR26DRAFT_854134 [Obelidium mucronatum]|nr:hypothetical protein BDR26DRAFT_854134 [Obelidium mucronatum]